MVGLLRTVGSVLVQGLKWAIALAICGGGIWGLYVYKYQQITQAIERAAEFPEPSETVELCFAGQSSYTPTISVIGEAVAPRQITIQNELPGQVEEVNFRSGDFVQKGQVILRINTAKELADIESAKATLVLAQKKFLRLSELLGQGAVSETEVDQANEALRVAKAKKKQLATDVAKKTLVAPFSGQLGIFQLNPGQFINVNTEIVSLIGNDKKIWIDFSVPQFYDGPEVGEYVNALPVKDARHSKAESLIGNAKIIAKDVSVNKDSRSVKYRAELDRRDYRPKQMFSVQVPIGKPQNYVTVPVASLRYDATGRFVFVLVPGSKPGQYRAKKRPVRISFQDDRSIYLESGLAVGEKVASVGAFKLREGLLVFPAAAEQEGKDQRNPKTPTTALKGTGQKETQNLKGTH